MEKLKLSTNYNTQATFDFDNQMKLEYAGKDDEIIKKIEAGNVTYPIQNTLIQGSQSLFGIRTDLKFGKLNISTVVSQNRGERKEIGLSKRIGGVSINQQMANFSNRLDIRGFRAEEVIPRLDQYIDEALMLGANELHILHGKGHGVLREIVRNHLKGFREVDSMKDEHADRGGAGITIVTLK